MFSIDRVCEQNETAPRHGVTFLNDVESGWTNLNRRTTRKKLFSLPTLCYNVPREGLPMEAQTNNAMTLWKNQCPDCSAFHRLLTAKVRDPWKKYNQAKTAAMELISQGKLELFAGDCPLEDASSVLNSEQYFTVCHYLRCKACGNLYYVGACIRGKPVFRRVTDLDEERIGFRLWGRCGSYFNNMK